MPANLTRRGFIKTGLSALAATYLLSQSAQAKQLEHYWQQYQKNRKKGTRRDISQGKIIDVQSLGAIGDGKTINTKVIQSAIDKVAASGQPGTVLIPAGVFLTGALHLASHVNVHVDKQGTLLGSVNIEDYEDKKGHIKALLDGENCQHVSISGDGIIDGQGRELALNINHRHHSGQRKEKDFNARRNRSRHRPNVVAMHHCSDVKIYDVTIKNSAFWVQHYAGCDNLHVDNIVVDSDAFWNNDGLDINDCRNVRITGCFVNAADDAICLKSTTGGEFYNDKITIADCVVRSSSNGIKFGTESKYGFTNVDIHNIQVFDTYRCAIVIATVDGAKLENIQINNIDARNVGGAIFIRLGQRNRDVPANTKPGSLKNISINNFKAQISFGRADLDYELRGPGLNTFFNPIPSSITGLPDAAVENVTLENIDITYPGRANKGLAYRPYDQLFLVPQERDAYPEYTMFGELPSWGLFVRHVKGIHLKNVTLRTAAADFRPALVFDDATDVKLDEVNIYAHNDRHLVVHDVKHLKVNQLKAMDEHQQLKRVSKASWHQSNTK